MNISQAAQACGLPSKTIRYYEDIGLVVPKRQEANDYRIYSLDDVAQLRFLLRARAVGFNLEECRELLALYTDPQRRCAQVRVLVNEKIVRVDKQLIALHALRDTLVDIAGECVDDNASDNPAINLMHEAKIAPSERPAFMAFTLVDTTER